MLLHKSDSASLKKWNIYVTVSSYLFKVTSFCKRKTSSVYFVHFLQNRMSCWPFMPLKLLDGTCMALVHPSEILFKGCKQITSQLSISTTE